MCRSMGWITLLLGLLCVVSQTRGQENHLACGKRKVVSQYLIHNGIDAKAGHWPWHVALFHRKDAQYEYACGGSILDENTILTASHCVYTQSGVISISRVSVDVGRIHLNESSEYTQTHLVREIIVHPGFSKNSIVNDIALIKLSSNITMNKYVQPVCLWTMDSNQELIVGRNGTIVGFGVNEQDIVSEQLKQALIGVVDPFSCIADDRGVFGTHLTSDMFCGKGQKGVSACNGDSGGGMFFEIGGKWFVRGLVSFTPLGTERCDSLKNTAYTDVAKYLKWIKPYIDQRVLSYDSDVLNIDYVEKLRLFNFETCGMKSSSYIKNGTTWALPWLGFVGPWYDLNSRCTITLISEWYAVGPAHCLSTNSVDSIVIFGSDMHQSKTECFDRNRTIVCTHPSQARRIKRIIEHQKLGSNSYENNIALIELYSPVDTMQPNVKPICMPVTSELRTNAKTNLHVAMNSSEEASYTHKNTPVRFIESVECVRRYSEHKIALKLENNRFCTEVADQQDVLNCTSFQAGAPLQEMKMLNGTERYFLRGVELHGLVCDLQAPAIYFDAEAYLDWILYNMRENVLDTMDVFETVTTNQTLEVEWSKLQQQPGKERLHLFNMDTCGLTTDGLEIYEASTTLPWNGIIMNDANFTGEVPLTRSMVVLISEWYALAPRRSIENDVAWRYIMLGVQLNDCITSQCKTQQVVEIKNIIIPPPNHPRQTFALIELLEPANLMNPYIRPICLPLMDQLHHHKPTEVGISINLDVETVKKKLAVIDNPSCKHGLRQESYFIDFNEDSRQCAIEITVEYKQIPVPSVLGSPLMMPVSYGGSTHYFLYGMDNNVPGEYNRSIFGPYLFDTVQSADLEWVVENVREHERQTSLPSTLTNGRVNLKPVQQASKSSLFNFNTCGESSSNFPMPWVGKRLSNAPFFNESSCLVTLISDWYVVGPADCFEEDSQKFVLMFGDTNETAFKECFKTKNYDSCIHPAQRVSIQKVFLHPQYNQTNRANDIALIQLATPVDTSRPNVRPICLPIIDTSRSYDISSLVMESSNFTITKVDDRYIDPVECQKRWQGLRASFTVDTSMHCVVVKRTKEDTCLRTLHGASLHSRQAMKSSDRHFLRGFSIIPSTECITYYPVVYINTDAYLDWILETMEQPGLSFDLHQVLIFSDK
uniref:Peptidase S1 domain-containing protein n=2 Tax=Anopheles coluzzii TaxID=1518534 RepID=A0A6E8WCZ9_ANOCL